MREKTFNTVFVVVAFFLSGFCGLVYEILWSRYLAELLGVTAMAQFVVLMVFMGGLALGALWIGRLVDRGNNGLIYYALLELGVFSFCSWLKSGRMISLNRRRKSLTKFSIGNFAKSSRTLTIA